MAFHTPLSFLVKDMIPVTIAPINDAILATMKNKAFSSGPSHRKIIAPNNNGNHNNPNANDQLANGVSSNTGTVLGESITTTASVIL